MIVAISQAGRRASNLLAKKDLYSQAGSMRYNLTHTTNIMIVAISQAGRRASNLLAKKDSYSQAGSLRYNYIRTTSIV